MNQLAFELFHSEEILSQFLKHAVKDQWQASQKKLMQHATYILQFTSIIIEKTEHHYADKITE